MEKASLQEALGRKEASEQGLVVELESLREQLQWVTQQQAELREENATLWSQKEALATGAEEREAGKKCQFQGGGGQSHEGRARGQQLQAFVEAQPFQRVQRAEDGSSLQRASIVWLGEGVRGPWSVTCLLLLEEAGCPGWHGHSVSTRLHEGRSLLGAGACLGQAAKTMKNEAT